jgi:hypothetical protein
VTSPHNLLFPVSLWVQPRPQKKTASPPCSTELYSPNQCYDNGGPLKAHQYRRLLD